MNVKNLLEKEIESQFEALDTLDYGSVEHVTAVDELTKLLSKHNELTKIELEHREAVNNREADIDLKVKQILADNELKERQMKDEKVDRIVKNTLTVFSLLVGTGLTIWGTKVSIDFEKTGTITTIMGRGFINKLLPKK